MQIVCLSNWLQAVSSALLMCTVMHGNSTSEMQHFVHADENTLTDTSRQTSFQGILFMQTFEWKWQYKWKQQTAPTAQVSAHSSDVFHFQSQIYVLKVELVMMSVISICTIESLNFFLIYLTDLVNVCAINNAQVICQATSLLSPASIPPCTYRVSPLNIVLLLLIQPWKRWYSLDKSCAQLK